MFLAKSRDDVFFLNTKYPLTCIDRRLDPELDLDKFGARRFVAPRPANKLFSNDGDLAQMNAWKDDTVKTPSLFKVLLVARDTWVSNDCNKKIHILYI